MGIILSSNKERTLPTLSTILINDGLNDIHHNKNPYGVARRLMENILQYRTYKNKYHGLRAGYINVKLRYYCHKAIQYSAEGGHKDFIDYFLKKHAKTAEYNYITSHSDNWDFGLKGAAKGGHMTLIEFFIKKGANLNWGLCGAAKKGNITLMEYFINNGADDWEWGLECAAEHSYQAVEYLIQKGARDFGACLYGAAKRNDTKLLQYCLERNAHHWELGLQGAAIGGNLELVKYFIDKGARHVTLIIDHIIKHRHRHILDYLILKKETDIANAGTDEIFDIPWNYCMYSAITHIDKNLVEYFINKGAKNYHEYLYHAQNYCNDVYRDRDDGINEYSYFVEFFQQKIKEANQET